MYLRIKKFKNCSAFGFAASVCMAVIYLSFSMHVPVMLNANSPHDDALFIGNAMHLVQGDWLGPYSQMTLSKGAGYSLFLAVNALLGIPITLLIAIFYLFSCGVFAKTLAGIGLRNAFVFAVFITLLFQPVVFPTSITRDNIYPSLTLLATSGILFITQQKSLILILRETILFGFAFGMFWITREEGVWILPGMCCYMTYQLVLARQDLQAFKLLCLRLFVYFAAAAVVPISIAFMNLFMYGKLVTVEFTNSSFSTVLSKLNSVSAGPEIPFLPVPQIKRQLIYQVSPAFRELESYFEDRGRSWTLLSCEVYKTNCGDYAGGGFMWALRDAVADKGYYSSPQKAANFYDQISAEIETACKNGKLICHKNYLPFLPTIPEESLKNIPSAILKAIKISIYNIEFKLANINSLGTAEDLQNMRLFLGNLKSMPTFNERSTFKIAGWYYSPENDWPSLDCVRDGTHTISSIPRSASPDIAASFNDKNAHSQRFSLSLSQADDCKIFIENHQGKSLRIEDLLIQKNQDSHLGSGTFFLDIKTAAVDPFAKSLRWKQKLADVYHWISPTLSIFGIASFVSVLGLSLTRRRPPSPLLWVAAMLWLHCLVRIALVVLIEVSSFPAVNYFYLSPILPLVCAASILSISLWVPLGKQTLATKKGNFA